MRLYVAANCIVYLKQLMLLIQFATDNISVDCFDDKILNKQQHCICFPAPATYNSYSALSITITITVTPFPSNQSPPSIYYDP